jgi:hypothetical protein
MELETEAGEGFECSPQVSDRSNADIIYLTETN